MTNKVLEDVVKRECPDMLSHEDFMHNLSCKFCCDDMSLSASSKKMRHLTDEEYEAYSKLRETLNTATIEQLVEYLQENFKLDDKLCYMDCVEGLKNDCKYVDEVDVGKRFFRYVKDMKRNIMKQDESLSKKDLDDMYMYVNDNDVIIA